MPYKYQDRLIDEDNIKSGENLASTDVQNRSHNQLYINSDIIYKGVINVAEQSGITGATESPKYYSRKYLADGLAIKEAIELLDRSLFNIYTLSYAPSGYDVQHRLAGKDIESIWETTSSTQSLWPGDMGIVYRNPGYDEERIEIWLGTHPQNGPTDDNAPPTLLKSYNYGTSWIFIDHAWRTAASREYFAGVPEDPRYPLSHGAWPIVENELNYRSLSINIPGRGAPIMLGSPWIYNDLDFWTWGQTLARAGGTGTMQAILPPGFEGGIYNNVQRNEYAATFHNRKYFSYRDRFNYDRLVDVRMMIGKHKYTGALGDTGLFERIQHLDTNDNIKDSIAMDHFANYNGGTGPDTYAPKTFFYTSGRTLLLSTISWPSSIYHHIFSKSYTQDSSTLTTDNRMFDPATDRRKQYNDGALYTYNQTLMPVSFFYEDTSSSTIYWVIQDSGLNLRYSTSVDDGQTWTGTWGDNINTLPLWNKVDMGIGTFESCGSPTCIMLSNGWIVIGHLRYEGTESPEDGGLFKAYFYYSKDNGTTWDTLSMDITADVDQAFSSEELFSKFRFGDPTNYYKPARIEMIQLPNGDILGIFARTKGQTSRVYKIRLAIENIGLVYGGYI